MRGSKPRIIEYMKTHDGITSQAAFKDLGITRLSARIKELRELGYKIRTVMVDGYNRYNEPVRYGHYILVEEPRYEKVSSSGINKR